MKGIPCCSQENCQCSICEKFSLKDPAAHEIVVSMVYVKIFIKVRKATRGG